MLVAYGLGQPRVKELVGSVLGQLKVGPEALFSTLGSDDFDRAYRDFYQQFRDSSATSAELLAAFHRVNPAADRIFQDWFLTTRWYTRLRAGESVEQIVETYRRP